MFKQIVIATKNKGKLKEFRNILKDETFEILSLDDFKVPDVKEDGKTFAENAIIKAEFIGDLLNLPVIADDSGLMVDILDGKPGIYSARFAGEDKNDRRNNEKLLRMLENTEQEKRTAKFVSAIALAVPGKETVVVEGMVSGIINFEPQGNNGFGYDPLFYLPQYQKTMAEISPELKNQISHRAVALQKIRDILHTKNQVIT